MKKKRWMPKNEERFYMVVIDDIDGEPFSLSDSYKNYESVFTTHNNCFRTRKQANDVVLKIKQILEDATNKMNEEAE